MRFSLPLLERRLRYEARRGYVARHTITPHLRASSSTPSLVSCGWRWTQALPPFKVIPYSFADENETFSVAAARKKDLQSHCRRCGIASPAIFASSLASYDATPPLRNVCRQRSFSDLALSETSSNKKQHTIKGIVGKVNHYNAVSNYHVFQMKSSKIDGESRSREEVKIVGCFPKKINEGESVTIKTSEEEQHPTYGPQFQFVEILEQCAVEKPSLVEIYLINEVEGIGKKYASIIYNYFGEKAWDVIATRPGKLLDIKDLPEKTAKSIVMQLKLVESGVKLQNLFRCLGQYGISLKESKRILCDLGSDENILDMIRKEPYCLLKIHGLSFKRVDIVATKMAKLSKDSHERYNACINDALVTNDTKHGSNTAFIREDFVKLMMKEPYQYETRQVHNLIPKMINKGVIVDKEYNGNQHIQHFKYYEAEKQISQRIKSIQDSTSSLPRVDAEAKMAEALQNSAFNSFSRGQRKAIVQALGDEKITILTGGPGTGKTAILGSLTQILVGMGASIGAAAPTGVAGRRLHKATGIEASTIHRLIGYDYMHDESALFNMQNKLEFDFLIIDEASMIDTMLFCALLSALPDHCHLLLVGDNDQLPSVGPGRILGDLIDCKKIPVTRLTDPFRQSEESDIAQIAHAVNNGNSSKSLPADMVSSCLSNLSTIKDIQFVEVSDSDLLGATETAHRFINEQLSLPETTHHQILTPSRKWRSDINELFQDMNPESILCPPFKKNDVVIQTRNDYRKDVYNGMVGTIEEGTFDDHVVANFPMQKTNLFRVNFGDDHVVTYSPTETEHLMLAYASTIHKSQGSEFLATIIALPDNIFYRLRTRKLLYTAITRGKKHVFILGSKQTYLDAVANSYDDKRCTLLRANLEK